MTSITYEKGFQTHIMYIIRLVKALVFLITFGLVKKIDQKYWHTNVGSYSLISIEDYLLTKKARI